MTGPRFADLADAGRQLGERLAADGIGTGWLALAVVPNGVPVAVAAARVAGLDVAGLPVARDDAGVHVGDLPVLAGRSVVVVDDGVETGAAARAAATVLRVAGATRLVLAVPVCPRGLVPDLATRYDRVVALEVPVDDRPLASSYARFDTVDVATAEEMLG